MSDYILLLDPSLREDNKHPSYNIGDSIIHASVEKVLHELFPGKPVRRMTSHGWFGAKEKNMINHAKLVFVGGTNILYSNITEATRLVPKQTNPLSVLFPGFKNIVLLGTGWVDYKPSPNWYTRAYYQKVLHHRFLHAIRDQYSVDQLKKTGLTNITNTSCPTTWELDIDFSNSYQAVNNQILFTLTDYNTNPEADILLIKALLDSGCRDLVFFPQGSGDLAYLQSLKLYQNNKNKIHLLGHSFGEWQQFTSRNKFNYIGTRLHAGIDCLKTSNPAMIVAIDNRAAEIGKDIGLNTVDRNNIVKIREWMENRFTPPPLRLPMNNIERWKNQFTVV